MRINKLIFLLFFLCSIDSFGQLKNRNIVWFIPSKDNRINGLAIGPYIHTNDTMNKHEQTVNGLNMELLGLGFRLPFSSAHPFQLSENLNNEKVLNFADSTLR